MKTPIRRRLCSFCGKIKPETLENFRLRRQQKNNQWIERFTTQCIECEQYKERMRREARREKAPPPPLDKSTVTEAQFNATVKTIEAQYGPYNTWSREVHAKHTQLLWREVAQRETALHLFPDQPNLTFARHNGIDYGNPLFRPPRQAPDPDGEGVLPPS